VSRDQLLELFGYLASIVVAVSLMMRSIVRLRWINLLGSLCFTIYGVLIEAFPVAALNLAIVAINVYFIVKMRRAREAFSVIEMAPDSAYLGEFLRFHGQDIHRFQPGFAHAAGNGDRALVVLRDLVPAGVLIMKPDGHGAAAVQLDYVSPAYRDFKIGDYLFNRRRDAFRALGVSRLETDAGNPAHAAYLERMGFTPVDGRYRLELGEAPAPAAT
jgi:GNAT superfamily N-acetyltransferase